MNVSTLGDDIGPPPVPLPRRRLSVGTNGRLDRGRGQADGLAAPPPDLRQRAQAMAETLGAVGYAAAVIGADGEMLAVNRPYAMLHPRLVRQLSGRPQFTDPVADRLLGEAFARLGTSTTPGAATRTIPIRRHGKPRAVAYLIATTAGDQDPLSGICGILIISSLRPQFAPNPQVVQRLFGLSPAETRVACAIAEGQTVEAIAEVFTVSRETVRSQLKSVLAKTGAKRQLDLAVLLCGLQLRKA